MTKLQWGLAALMSLTSLLVTHSEGQISQIALNEKILCHGIMEENDLNIPDLGPLQNKGLTREQFDDVLDRIETVFTPIIRSKGGELEVNRLWDDGTVNASAQRSGRTWVINMYGGLARHPAVTKEAFALVACHEIGHHVGGAPKVRGFFGSHWATNEGQADYYASLKCMRQIFPEADSLEFVKNNEIPDVVKERCAQSFNNEAEQSNCALATLAGLSITRMFRQVKDLPKDPAFDTPNTTEVSETFDSHPEIQCRLDTYFSGAVCTRLINDDVDNRNVLLGTCNASEGFDTGLRPRCWFKP